MNTDDLYGYVYACYILFLVMVGLYFFWLLADEKKLDRLRSIIKTDSQKETRNEK